MQSWARRPVKTLGVTDQHSQLQLYTEGPYDKVHHLPEGGRVPRGDARSPTAARRFPDVAFLGGKSLNQLIEAERQGTEYALYKCGPHEPDHHAARGQRLHAWAS